MKLYMKQKVFSFTDKFTVKDELGEDKYYVEGEFLYTRLHILDKNGIEVANIYKKFFSLMPRFFININGRQELELVKEFTLFNQRYYLEGTSISLQGDFMEHNYSLSDNEHCIMNISKEWFTWGDSYMLDIANPTDELLCLCVVLAIDCVNDHKGNHSNVFGSF